MLNTLKYSPPKAKFATHCALQAVSPSETLPGESMKVGVGFPDEEKKYRKDEARVFFSAPEPGMIR